MDIHNILLDAEKTLEDKGILRLGKMCSQEYICIEYFADKNRVCSKIKSHWSTDKSEVRKVKRTRLDVSISFLVDDIIYKLVTSEGYEILKEW